MNKILAILLCLFCFVPSAKSADIEGEFATLGMLDKITGRFSEEVVKVGEVLKFQNLEIKVKSCLYRPPEETPENTAYVEIIENKHNKSKVELFKGWMFSSTTVSSVESPIYDVWVLLCN
ncbi:MAG: hypothetical protein BWY78_00809 [Alphaproteobacteria bacterium ADurb.Bin438]|nr:MAG: hypothetical protein BWY78_00809 [Alphaproteobacteria bacterium ADurb.Bin438]